MSIYICVWWDQAKLFEAFRARCVGAIPVILAVVLFEFIFRFIDFKMFRRPEKSEHEKFPKVSNRTVKLCIRHTWCRICRQFLGVFFPVWNFCWTKNSQRVIASVRPTANMNACLRGCQALMTWLMEYSTQKRIWQIGTFFISEDWVTYSDVVYYHTSILFPFLLTLTEHCNTYVIWIFIVLLTRLNLCTHCEKIKTVRKTFLQKFCAILL